MQNILAEGQVKNAKVMTVGNTCFMKDSKSVIDYGIVDPCPSSVVVAWQNGANRVGHA